MQHDSMSCLHTLGAEVGAVVVGHEVTEDLEPDLDRSVRHGLLLDGCHIARLGYCIHVRSMVLLCELCGVDTCFWAGSLEWCWLQSPEAEWVGADFAGG